MVNVSFTDRKGHIYGQKYSRFSDENIGFFMAFSMKTNAHKKENAHKSLNNNNLRLHTYSAVFSSE